jgi:hypothetical protein
MRCMTSSRISIAFRWEWISKKDHPAFHSAQSGRAIELYVPVTPASHREGDGSTDGRVFAAVGFERHVPVGGNMIVLK